MKRLAVLALLFVGFSALGQSSHRIWTATTMPGKDVLDRLNLQLAWRTLLPVESRRDGIANMQHLGTDLFIQLRDGLIFCLDPETGAVRWSKRIGNRYPVARRLGHGPDHVFVIDGSRIIALNRSDGTQHWDLELSEVPIAPPMAGELFFYVPFANGRVQTYSLPETFAKVQKLDSDQKAKLRQFVQDVRTKLKATEPTSVTGSDPRSAGGDLLRGRSASPSSLEQRSGTTMSATLASRGEAKRLTEKGAAAPDRPVLINSNSPGFRATFPVTINTIGVLVTGNDREALLLRRDPENPIFRFVMDSKMALPPVEFGNHAYITCEDSTVHAVDLVAGLTSWRFSPGSMLVDTPVATEDSLFIETAGRGVFRVDRKTGNSVWQQPEATRFQAVNNQFVYATDRFGKLLVLDRASGAIQSRYDLSSFNVLFANHQTDRLILAANDGTIMALHDKSQVQPLEYRKQPPAKKILPDAKTPETPK